MGKEMVGGDVPLVSVLVPVYQAEQFLDRCINSVLNQTYPNIELLLVDDGSTDESASIGKKYEKNSRVTYRVIEHGGVSRTRQELVKMSRGEYLFFLDSDDFIDPKTIQVLYNMALEYDADMVQCSMVNTASSTIAKTDYKGTDIRVYSSKQALYHLQCGYGLLRCMLAAKLYSRKVLQDIIFPVGKIHEDEFTMHWIIASCSKILSTKLPLYYYYQNYNSITKGSFSYARYDILEAIQDRISFCRNRCEKFSADMNCLRYCFYCIRLYRQTYYEIDNHDRHLPILHQAFLDMAQYVISTGCLEVEMENLLNLWITNPLKEDIPSFWATATKYYRANENREKT